MSQCRGNRAPGVSPSFLTWWGRVGGEVRTADGKWAERRNPISGEVVTRAAAAIADAAAEAAGTFGDWAGMGASGVE